MSSSQQLLLGEGAGGAIPAYIEEVFSPTLYTGTGTSQTVTTNINASLKGALFWIKCRSSAEGHRLTDTVRGPNFHLSTDFTGGQDNDSNRSITATTSGFTTGPTASAPNTNGERYVAWTFAEQPKFFDIVTYTGNGAANNNITHNLGSLPGMIVIKKTSGTGNWATAASLSSTVYAIGGGGSGSGYEFALNKTDSYYDNPLKSTIATDTTVNVPKVYYNDATVCNASGATYVMYLFASDAGGFGLTGTDNVISCGSYTGNSSATGVLQNLGWEPQWVMIKSSTDGSQDWAMFDNMRGVTTGVGGVDARLVANKSEAENNGFDYVEFNATGFTPMRSQTLTNNSSNTYIYVAIRRGPMKVPTSATNVFTPVLGRSANPNYLAGFPVDLGISEYRINGSNSTGSRLQGSNSMDTASTGAEASDGSLKWDFMDGYYTGGRTTDFISWAFRRAPSFCDVVCYTGTAPTAQNLTHNLGVAPEFIIIKRRDAGGSWFTGSMFTSTTVTRAVLNSNSDQDLNNLYSGQSIWGGQPTSSVFSVGTGSGANASGGTYVAYLFATCAGVSKVGNYTGNGSTQTINCGFGAGGARFVLIKRVDTSGDWYVYDTARGMTVLTDPYLLLNSTAAEVATLGSVTTVSTGFALNSAILAAINVNGGTYIFLAIA